MSLSVEPAKNAKLSDLETREIITPYAFRIHEPLLGLPLARPWRRAFAIFIDGTLIGLLSLVPSAMLLLAASIFLWLASRKPTVKRRGLLRMAAIVGGLIGMLSLVASNESVQSGVEKAAHVIRVAQYRGDVESGACRDARCARERLDDLAWLVVHGVTDDGNADRPLDDYLQGLDLDPADREDLRRSYENQLKVLGPADGDEKAVAMTEEADTELANIGKSSPSPLSWAKGALQDLGLSLGWAALYFSAFTVGWNGQTPGKRLMHIRVQMLNGARISWWDAFSRYGGYGAGFATGLLGFLQLIWDANRQAIQDKIVGTVVIYDNSRISTESQ